ncbi:hypothetical protein Snoj_21710 [Streptomyces nojiriensis]|uniref:Uncharacterized protein n=1 Tax=Streptomyces nojiriensis TaxID=66374 RepID=A0ABQ3SJD9_9ACTN|nr:hypothetical protein [Streptomyces nojiriensis]QTI49860.1 hypothetical protein JYK04_07733 [Streptomyces nojiriensis]GGS20843.1 hypothetical protein GCM10010205_58490 [Streptomyces nojiriensis]GHI68253.1 hypothetical protein Snoj_21710 [Streptomyces nojiriensis]
MFARTSRIAIAAATTILALSTAAATATAAPAPRNCVLDIDSGSMQCYDTFQEAVTASTNGRITDAPLSAKHIDEKLADRLKGSSSTAGAEAVQLGVIYTDSNYGGSALVLTGGSGCQSGNGRDAQINLEGTWNNSVSSLTTLSCWLELWDAPNTSGVHQEYQQSTSYIGDAMNDRASSIALL